MTEPEHRFSINLLVLSTVLFTVLFPAQVRSDTAARFHPLPPAADYLQPLIRRAAPLQLSEQQRAWIAQHPLIRLGPDPDFKPIEFFEKTTWRGISADFTSLLMARIGLECSDGGKE